MMIKISVSFVSQLALSIIYQIFVRLQFELRYVGNALLKHDNYIFKLLRFGNVRLRKQANYIFENTFSLTRKHSKIEMNAQAALLVHYFEVNLNQRS